MDKCFCIGISGCSASGKSTFSKLLKQKLENKKVYLIQADTFFFKELPKTVSPLNGKVYDDFNSVDTLDYKSLIAEIKNASSTNDIVIVEGVLIFCFKEIRELMNILLYIDAPIEIRMGRRLKRNTQEYGMKFDDVLDYYINAARYSEKKNTEASKIYADIIVNGEQDFIKPLEIVSSYIKSKI